MEIVIPQLLFALVIGGVCAAIAQSRGRNPLGWFIVGAFLNCIGIVLVLVLPDLNQQEARRRKLELENRRLRQQLGKPTPESVPPAPPTDEQWWWVETGERRGPVSFDELRRLWWDGAIDTDTLVWKSGMPEWLELADVPDLSARLGDV